MCMCRAIYPKPAWLSLRLSAPALLQYGRPGAFVRPRHEPPISCVGGLPRFPPPTVIAHQLAQTHHLAVGIEIETHILVPGNMKVWAEGQFGFKTTIYPDSINAMRLFEIGFAIGDCHGGVPIAGNPKQLVFYM